jgi:hypothetical protein
VHPVLAVDDVAAVADAVACVWETGSINDIIHCIGMHRSGYALVPTLYHDSPMDNVAAAIDIVTHRIGVCKSGYASVSASYPNSPLDNVVAAIDAVNYTGSGIDNLCQVKQSSKCGGGASGNSGQCEHFVAGVVAESHVAAGSAGASKSIEDLEPWEDELNDMVRPCIPEVQSWGILQQQINVNIKKNEKTLALKAHNWLLIIWNFVTLCLKGLGPSMLAWILPINGMKKVVLTLLTIFVHLLATIRYLSSCPRTDRVKLSMQGLCYRIVLVTTGITGFHPNSTCRGSPQHMEWDLSRSTSVHTN